MYSLRDFNINSFEAIHRFTHVRLKINQNFTISGKNSRIMILVITTTVKVRGSQDATLSQE